MTIKEVQQEIIDEFSMFDDWMQRYEYIIELGKNLPLIDEKYQVEENLIKGCQSQVWLLSVDKNNAVVFSANSDDILSKGIIEIFVRVFSGQ
jgi:cysteine desulfuration protein SufE